MLPRLLLVLLLVFMIGSTITPAAAQTSLNFSVNTTLDAVDINIGDGVCNTGAAPGDECSLRAAIQEGNAFAGVTFISVNNSGGPMGLSIAGVTEDASATGDLDITGSIEIGGPGTVDGNDVDRVFHVLGGGRLELLAVNVIDGTSPGVENGGGLLITGLGSFLEINFSEIASHTSGGRGGAMRIEDGATAKITGSSISNNTAASSGGGISVRRAGLTLTNTTVSTNAATNDGGGIIVDNASADVTVPNNLKFAIFNNVTIASNTATDDGGGLANFKDISPVMSNTVLTGNTAAGGLGPNCLHFSGGTDNATEAFDSLGNNLIASSAGCVGWNITDLVDVTAGLAAAAQINGITHLKPASTASNVVNAGGTFSCEPHDAVGTLRPQGSGCDIGAIELKVGFAGSIQATPMVALGQLVTVTVTDPDLRFAGQINITASTRVNDTDFESEVFTLNDTGFNDVFTGTFLVQLNSVPAPTNGVIDIIGEGMITFIYVDLPNGNGEFNVSNRIYQTQVTGFQGDAVVNPSFELDLNNDKTPDGWKKSNTSGDKLRCNKLNKPPVAFDGVCAWEMKNTVGALTQKVPLPLSANIDDDMFLEVLVSSNAPRPGVIASIKIKESDGDVESCKINLLAGTNSGAGGYEAYQCNVEPELEQINGIKITLSTPGIGGGKIIYDRVSLLTIVPRERTAADDSSAGVLPAPLPPSGFRR